MGAGGELSKHFQACVVAGVQISVNLMPCRCLNFVPMVNHAIPEIVQEFNKTSSVIRMSES